MTKKFQPVQDFIWLDMGSEWERCLDDLANAAGTKLRLYHLDLYRLAGLA